MRTLCCNQPLYILPFDHRGFVRDEDPFDMVVMNDQIMEELIGSFGNGDIQAWTAASDVGFTFENAPLKPRLGLKANVTSGDDNPNNADLQTFNPLFPKGAYFGEPALIGPANHIDVHPQLELALRRNVMLTLDWDCFWRESTHEGIYGPAVNLIQSGQTSNAVTWAIRQLGQAYHSCGRLRAFLRRRFPEANHPRQRRGLFFSVGDVPLLKCNRRRISSDRTYDYTIPKVHRSPITVW